MAKKSFKKRIPFNVSARAARLIGRENVANAEGAIIELVKNSYDADASVCILYFNSDKSLQIIDNGHGMNSEIIEKFWMTIGTNNKELDVTTNLGRVKTGAKGIGRFALDRLGEVCTMHTLPSESKESYLWEVNWKDFDDDDSATIGDINASLEESTSKEFYSAIKDFCKLPLINKSLPNDLKFDNGTIIQIEKLRDRWTKSAISKLFRNLSSLIPPKEEKDFSIFVLSNENPDDFGAVDNSVCDDYDYKVFAKCDKNQNVTIQITRNEQDLKKLDKKIFKRPKMKKFPYDYATFSKKTFTLKYKLAQLVPGYADTGKADVLNKLGIFEFTFYFMKKSTSEEHKNRFYYRDFDSARRNMWLEEQVGIRIFRDSFRVRPYGEPKGPAYDWLPLAPRYQASPAGVAKKEGGYRVRDNNISGSVEISRLTNIQLQDKMNREGIQENQAFDIFKQILIGIISVFEADRSYIARELDAYYSSLHPEDKISEEAEEIKNRQKNKKKKTNTAEEHEIQVLTEHSDNLKKKIESLVSDQKILRVLASNGAMVASFAHELYGIKNHLMKRTDTIRQLISPYIKQNDLEKVPEHKNPLIFIDDMQVYDKKLNYWMQFALGTIRKDKRTRKNLNIAKYLEGLGQAWTNHLEERQSTIKIKIDDPGLKLKAFEIDFDTIFNNLIINSLDAFQRKFAPNERTIKIHCREQNKNLKIIYSDSGPGLSKDIKNPDDIFNIHYSTKRDPNSGEEIGTGIGMWLIKSTVDEYNGTVSLDKTVKSGFSISILLPLEQV